MNVGKAYGREEEMKKKRITKKTAETVFKKFIGTSKGIKNLGDHVRDMWMIEQGMIKAYCCYEEEYGTLGIPRYGEHIMVWIEIEEIISHTFYLDSETLETDNMYTLNKTVQQEQENIREWLDIQGLVAVPISEAEEAGINGKL